MKLQNKLLSSLAICFLTITGCSEEKAQTITPVSDESLCGNGTIEEDEICDDNNTDDGDGCSADCSAVEDGYVCQTEGKPCKKLDENPDKTAACGNGILENDEICDDNNTQNGDGCSSNCTIESGWTCEPDGTCSPIADSAICGDGVISGAETCDDGNTNDNDGCTSTCSIQNGWDCSAAGQKCTPKPENEVCGDRQKTASEECDDGNTKSGDGCSSVCTTERGWVCSDTTCSTVCGDGIIAGTETCDDGNTNDNDGCTATCSIQTGWICSTAGSPCIKQPDTTQNSISILAIGNSFSQDAMQYLYDTLAAVGYEKITLANLHIGGCSLERHVSEIKSELSSNSTDGSYTFQVHSNLNNGKLVSVNNFKATDAFNFKGKFNNKALTDKYNDKTLEALDNGWDYISVQQSSPLGGIASTYILNNSKTGQNDINYIINQAKKNSKNAKIIWHMTWAFQTGSVRPQFVYYGKDQLKMYNITVATTKDQILNNNNIDLIIPSGTAIQNLRTSIIGDNLTRDGYHMSLSHGRLAVAMMWTKQITGRSIDSITKDSLKLASDYHKLYTTRMLKAIKTAVNNAYAHPFEVTPDLEGISEKYYKPNTELQKVFTNAGYKLGDYRELPFGLIKKAYYNSSSSPDAICKYTAINDNCSAILVSEETGGTNTSLLKSLAATRIFNRYELPVGSIIVLKDGYQYRPEAWTDLTKTTESRPGMVSTQIVKITTDWWGDYKYRAFNISKLNRPELSDAEMEKLSSAIAIFVPKDTENTDKVLKDNGYDVSKYQKLDIELTNDAYWNPTVAHSSSWTSTHSDNKYPTKIYRSYAAKSPYATTKVFTKDELLNGTLIVVAPGYQYRPDAWKTLSKEITSRPAMVTTTATKGSVIKVTDNWWGDYKYRAFNISKSEKPDLNYLEQFKINDKFAIYVPK